MPRDEFSEMRAFLEVARERSFTRAATKLGVTRSALSHTIRALEDRLGVRLLSRTTRDVATTAAGQRLFDSVSPHFESIAAEISAIGALRDRPSGNLRIVCPDDAMDLVFRPRLAAFLQTYSDISVELIIDNSFTNIVEQRFDAGVRLGEAIARDMVSARIGPDFRYCVVGSPDYFARYCIPQHPQDLADHNCINLRMMTSGGIYAWEFKKDAREFGMPVEGQLTLNTITSALSAVVAGLGLAYVPRGSVEPYIKAGQLQEVLADWCPVFQGYHLYYPSRRNPSPAFAAFLAAFRHKS
jgi:DNA-binding transcriptional LysR family regulator